MDQRGLVIRTAPPGRRWATALLDSTPATSIRFVGTPISVWFAWSMSLASSTGALLGE